MARSKAKSDGRQPRNLRQRINVDNLTWRKGWPPQVMIKDLSHKGWYIRVNQGGGKTWAIRYKMPDKPQRFYFYATYQSESKGDGLSCTDAFAEYQRLFLLVNSGVDPKDEKQRAQQAKKRQQARAGLTVAVLFDEHYYPYIQSRQKSAGQKQARFNSCLRGVIGDTLADKLTKQDVYSALSLYAHSFHLRRQLLRLISAMYRWAADPKSDPQNMGRAVLDIPNPCREISMPEDDAPKPEIRALTMPELATIWRALDDRNTHRAIKLQLLTACRVNEVAGAAVAELDMHAGVWKIPGARTKNGREHVIPILPAIRREVTPIPESGYLLPSASPRGKAKHVTQSGALQAIKKVCRAAGIEGVNNHVLRKTAASNLGRLGVDGHIIDRILNHLPKSVRGRHYDGYTYLDQKSEALQLWHDEIARYVDSPSQSSHVRLASG